MEYAVEKTAGQLIRLSLGNSHEARAVWKWGSCMRDRSLQHRPSFLHSTVVECLPLKPYVARTGSTVSAAHTLTHISPVLERKHGKKRHLI